MTDEERIKLAKMEEKIDGVDRRLGKIEEKWDTFFETQEQKHFELMNHFSSETTKIGVEFGRQLSSMGEEIDKKKAGKWVEKVLWGIGAIVGTGIVVAILDKILIK